MDVRGRHMADKRKGYVELDITRLFRCWAGPQMSAIISAKLHFPPKASPKHTARLRAVPETSSS